MDFATILCIGYKWLGEKEVHVPSIMNYKGWKKDPTDDSKLVKDFLEVYKQADMTVTYFGSGFDRPAFTAKVLEHGLEVPPSVPMVDLFYTVKSNMAISRKSLQNVGYYLGLSTEKTPVEGKVWRKAQAGDEGSIQYVLDHCEADVKILEEAYLKLRPLVRTHPRVAAYADCRFCGGKVQSRGYAITSTKGERQRFQCMTCGGWDTRAKLKG